MLFAEVVCIIVVIFTNLFGDPQNLIQTCCWFLLCHRLTETVSLPHVTHLVVQVESYSNYDVKRPIVKYGLTQDSTELLLA